MPIEVKIRGHWRKRGEEMRRLADEITNPDMKKRLLKLAAEYEELEERAKHASRMTRETGEPPTSQK